jgi:preprotein translocase subunit SecG|tara:strand:+ start:216 stop:521 length:306 start_codon:yes stop_codon:yes gene_type:complete
MENILLTVDAILAIFLVILILLQKSEGGALGLGVSQDNFMFSRTAGDFLSKSTAVVATLFIICSLSLTIISRQDLPSSTSIIDKIDDNQENNLPKIPKSNN